MELILTDEEKAAHSWLELDDESLGKMIKATAVKYASTPDGEIDHMHKMTCAMILCNMAADVNSTTSTFTLNGLTKKGEPQGDWKVTVKRVKSPK